MPDSIEVREFTAVEVQGQEQIQLLDSAPTEVREVLYVEVGVGGPQGPPGASDPVEVYDLATPPVAPTFPYIRVERDGAGDIQAVYFGTAT